MIGISRTQVILVIASATALALAADTNDEKVVGDDDAKLANVEEHDNFVKERLDKIFEDAAIDDSLNEVDVDEKTEKMQEHHKKDHWQRTKELFLVVLEQWRRDWNLNEIPPFNKEERTATDVGTARFLFSPVRGQFSTAFTLLTTPQIALNNLLNRSIAFIMTQFMWMWLHFLFWDYTQTQTAERFSITTLLTFLSNPNLALLNQLIIWMTALTASIVFSGTVVILNNVPAVRTFLINSLSFVGGSGRRRKRSEMPLDHHRHNRLFASHSATETHGTARISPTFTQTDIGTAFRRILCPICVARIMAFNTLSFTANFIVWILVPYLRGPNFVPTPVANAGRRRSKRSALHDLDVWAIQDHDLSLPPPTRDEVLGAVEEALAEARAKYEACMETEFLKRKKDFLH